MAAIAFDPLGYTRELEASGVPRNQAEVHAKAMTANFLHNFDALVTRDYLDTRFTEFETRVSAEIQREVSGLREEILRENSGLRDEMRRENSGLREDMLSEFTKHRKDTLSEIAKLREDMLSEMARLREGMLGKISELRDEMHREISKLREEMHREMGDIRGTLKLHSWMSAMLIAGVFVPMLQKLVA
jgi:gas vesicle protein